MFIKDWDVSNGLEDDFEFHLEWIEAAKEYLNQTVHFGLVVRTIQFISVVMRFKLAGYHTLNDIAWFQPNASPSLSCRFFTASHETIIWARKEKKAKHTFNYDLTERGYWPEDQLKKPGLQMRSVWSMGTPKPGKKIWKHPTQKPLDLLKRIVLAVQTKEMLFLIHSQEVQQPV